MERFSLLFLLTAASALNLKYLNPVRLQTVTSPTLQQDAAYAIINRYSNQSITVEINSRLFSNNRDAFTLNTVRGTLRIRASTGVAAVWGFNYYLKKYCKSQIAWQVQRIAIPNPMPEVDETVVANDRFRYYQNVCTASYSFVWWNIPQWQEHVDWMALNGINLALAPIAQEYAWEKVYRRLGMTDEEIDQHFTGPAFLSWLRMGNVHGWGGPLPQSWHDVQRNIQDYIVDYMFKLGMIPVYPAFNGHVPKAFARIFPNSTFHKVEKWNKFGEDYCCGFFLDPNDPLFKVIGRSFLTEISEGTVTGHIYSVDPFNEVKIQTMSTALVQSTSTAIYSTLEDFDNEAVWLLQNWMFVSSPMNWPVSRVKTFLTTVPNGRMLVLDLQAEQWPQYSLYDMYYGQPFIWCMLHNFGGTLGMFGSVISLHKEVYKARDNMNSTMIGIGLTPEGINQNYVVYDLMLESAWRKSPVTDLDAWVGDYAERRYGCNNTTDAWKYLFRSVYSFDGLNMVRGKYVITRRPSFKIKPWAWYKSRDLFEAFRKFLNIDESCACDGFYYDLVDVVRQALQYRAEQLYINLQRDRFSTSWVFNASISQYLDAMNDIEIILSKSRHFSARLWLANARSFARNPEELRLFELNARNQITMWGPNGEISDYACKQWFELFTHYYRPRWETFLYAALDAKVKNEIFDERSTQQIIKSTVEEKFLTVSIPSDVDYSHSPKNAMDLAWELYQKWAIVPDLQDLPMDIIRPNPQKATTLADVETSREEPTDPTVVMLFPTTPLV